MAERVASVTAQLPWFVFERDGIIVGYAYATPWRVRSAYRFSVETTVYAAPDCVRRGVGRQLYQTLIETLRDKGLKAMARRRLLGASTELIQECSDIATSNCGALLGNFISAPDSFRK
jgi:L-amino acid N-acyltransferase YncA